jgi:hypothetical protein
MITQHGIADRDLLANIAHSQRSKSAVRHVCAGCPRYKPPASRASKIKWNNRSICRADEDG